MKFKYKKYRNGILRPVIRIDIFYKNSEEKFPLEVLVDSGADKSVLPAEIGLLLGLDVEQGKEEQFMGITGVEKAVYTHKVDMAVGGHRISTEAGFTHALPPQAIGVVGQNGFFNFFIVKFDLIKGIIELKFKE